MSDPTKHSNEAIVMSIARAAIQTTIRSLEVINRARLENREVTEDELRQLAGEDDLARAKEAAAIERARAEGR